MALNIEKKIDLTSYEKNPVPKRVQQLSIIHEARNGELVQYYIDPQNSTQGDKCTHAIGIQDEKEKTWSYVDYDAVTWESPGQRISGNRIERLGVKAFPDVGAIAFYKLAYRDISRIVAPVNREGSKLAAPVLSAEILETEVTFTITPPEKEEYIAYRIILMSGQFSIDYITYELSVTVPAPSIGGEYQCFCIGYVDEGQICSKDSNVLNFTFDGSGEDHFEEPFYSQDELRRLKKRLDEVYSKSELDEKIDNIISKIQDGDVVDY